MLEDCAIRFTDFDLLFVVFRSCCCVPPRQLLLFIPPSLRTPYFWIQKLSLASRTKGSLLRIFSNGWKLKSARSWHTLAYFGILLHTLAYSGILWHTLAYSG